MEILCLKKIQQGIYHIIIKWREKRVKIKEIQQKIDNMDYWDMKVLDIKTIYFGDEVEIIVDNDEENCWKMTFISCYKVSYETDADRRKISYVREMKRPQLGYYAQDISVFESKKNDFYMVNVDLSIMEIQIECKEIVIESISKKNMELFWNHK